MPNVTMDQPRLLTLARMLGDQAREVSAFLHEDNLSRRRPAGEVESGKVDRPRDGSGGTGVSLK